MQLSLSHSFPLPHLPEGLTIQSYDQIQSIDILTETMNRSYEGLWGHLHVSKDEMARSLPFFDQEGMFLLFAPNTAVVRIVRARIQKAFPEKH